MNRLSRPTTLLAFLGAVLLPAALPVDPVPSFSDPTHITNPWSPFVPGAVKLFRGRQDGAPTALLETHLKETRDFDWQGKVITCCILEERDFEHGQLAEISSNYLAQDDAGNVWSFGEVSLIVESGVVVGDEADSWLVGGPQVGDPADVLVASDPLLFMLANPQVGDTFAQQPAPGAGETLTVTATDLTVKLPGGTFTGVVRVQEVDDGEDGADAVSSRWLAPGVGVIKDKEHHGHTVLIGSEITAAN
jgi:hypothetical protein